jgi:hypothetical protein
MAKKYESTGMSASAITADQLKQIANKLRESPCSNVFDVTCSICGSEVEDGDAVFTRLEKEESLFRCEECNFWKSTMYQAHPEMCTNCDDDAAMYDEEDDF